MTDQIDYFGAQDEMAPADDKMARLNALVTRYEDLKDDVDYHATKMTEAEEQLKKVVREEIPELMAEIGFSEIKTENGMNVKVDGKVNCSIKNENKLAAFTWLREHDFGGLIKSKLQVEFGKGEDEDAKKAIEVLEEIGITAGVEDAVHPATLKSWATERLEAGEEIPASFSVFEYKEAKISVPKAKKSSKVK